MGVPRDPCPSLSLSLSPAECPGQARAVGVPGAAPQERVPVCGCQGHPGPFPTQPRPREMVQRGSPDPTLPQAARGAGAGGTPGAPDAHPAPCQAPGPPLGVGAAPRPDPPAGPARGTQGWSRGGGRASWGCWGGHNPVWAQGDRALPCPAAGAHRGGWCDGGPICPAEEGACDSAGGRLAASHGHPPALTGTVLRMAH